jgi:hypothetical protein
MVAYQHWQDQHCQAEKGRGGEDGELKGQGRMDEIFT